MVHLTIRCCLATAVLTPVGAHTQPTDDSLRAYAVSVGTSYGVYLGEGLLITAAHVGGRACENKPSVRIAGLGLPANVIKEGASDRMDDAESEQQDITKYFVLASTIRIFIVTAAEKPAEVSAPSLIMTPPISIAFSGPQGGPFSPSVIEYRVSASGGTVNYSISTPSWLTASPNSGMTDTSGVTIRLSVNASASSLPPGAYGPGIAFTNVSNGRGSTTSPAKLIIQARSPTRPADQIPHDRGEYLLDSSRGSLLDDYGGRLLAK
jgi:hypothetical protein